MDTKKQGDALLHMSTADSFTNSNRNEQSVEDVSNALKYFSLSLSTPLFCVCSWLPLLANQGTAL